MPVFPIRRPNHLNWRDHIRQNENELQKVEDGIPKDKFHDKCRHWHGDCTIGFDVNHWQLKSEYRPQDFRSNVLTVDTSFVNQSQSLYMLKSIFIQVILQVGVAFSIPSQNTDEKARKKSKESENRLKQQLEMR